MKSIFIPALAIKISKVMLAITLFTTSLLVSAYEIKWTNKPPVNDVKLVKLSNGIELEIREDSKSRQTNLNIRDKKNITIDSDNYISILAAWPNVSRADVILVYSNCQCQAGNNSTFLIVPSYGWIHKYAIGYDINSLKAEIEKGELKAAVAIQKTVDILGDRAERSLTFVVGFGFVSSEMNRKYHSILKENNYFNYFSDRNLRAPLLRLMGDKAFGLMRREIQSTINNDEDEYPQVIDGRYIVRSGWNSVVGCCSFSGYVLIDGVTDEVWWLHRRDDEFESGGSKRIHKDDRLMRYVFSRIHVYGEGYEIAIGDNGFPTLKQR